MIFCLKVLEVYWLRSTVTGSLAGRHVLVIRSHRHDDEFIRLLSASGARVTRTPVIDIVPGTDEHAIIRQILAFDEMDIAIFVSVHGARFAMDWLDQYWPMLPQGVTYFAIGQQTEVVLLPVVHKVLRPEKDASSEGLLRMLELQNVSGKNVVIFRGGAGRELIHDELVARGARVSYCDVYARVVNQQQVKNACYHFNSIDYLVAHSGESLRALGRYTDFQSYIGENRFKVIVPSTRVAEIARELGYGSIVEAEGALPQSMYLALSSDAANC